jgi:hypothetical protein
MHTKGGTQGSFLQLFFGTQTKALFKSAVQISLALQTYGFFGSHMLTHCFDSESLEYFGHTVLGGQLVQEAFVVVQSLLSLIQAPLVHLQSCLGAQMQPISPEQGWSLNLHSISIGQLVSNKQGYLGIHTEASGSHSSSLLHAVRSFSQLFTQTFS